MLLHNDNFATDDANCVSFSSAWIVPLRSPILRCSSSPGRPPSHWQDDIESSSQGGGEEVLSSGSVHVTASLVKVLGFLLAEGMENVDHYKMVVLRERGPWEPAASRGRRGRNRGRVGSITAMETYLCFWCQSASTCFSEIDKLVHSIVLTSGENIWESNLRVQNRCREYLAPQ